MKVYNLNQLSIVPFLKSHLMNCDYKRLIKVKCIMEWLTFLFISSFALTVNCQNVIQDSSILNPDNIYFADNRPSTKQPVTRQINTPNANLQPPYNNVDVVQVPVTQLNVIETSTSNWNIVQKPVNNFNIVPQPSFDPTTINRHSEEIATGTIRLDENAVALTNFSINVMKNIILQKQGNTVISPYSIATILSLLQQGASQLALEQISVALQMSAQTSAAVYKSQTQDILRRGSRNILRTANNIFVADAFNLNPQFKAVAQKNFNSNVTPTTFQRPDQAARLINSWVASRTNNKIDKLISPESLSVNTQMVLVNAIYFKGLWATPFRLTSTRVDTFTLGNGATKDISFMMARRFCRAGVDIQTGAKVAIIPFEGDEYSMMIIVPSETSNAQNTLTTLTVSQLESYLNLKPIEVVLKIPKFTIKADTDLTPVLRQMGVTQIFEQSSGLVGLGMFQTFTPQVSSAVHSAVLSIDENGSTAAAASAFSVVALSNDETPLFIKADRPFVAVLWDEKSKVPLFMVKIEDPSLV